MDYLKEARDAVKIVLNMWIDPSDDYLALGLTCATVDIADSLRALVALETEKENRERSG